MCSVLLCTVYMCETQASKPIYLLCCISPAVFSADYGVTMGIGVTGQIVCNSSSPFLRKSGRSGTGCDG